MAKRLKIAALENMCLEVGRKVQAPLCLQGPSGAQKQC